MDEEQILLVDAFAQLAWNQGRADKESLEYRGYSVRGLKYKLVTPIRTYILWSRCAKHSLVVRSADERKQVVLPGSASYCRLVAGLYARSTNEGRRPDRSWQNRSLNDKRVLCHEHSCVDSMLELFGTAISIPGSLCAESRAFLNMSCGCTRSERPAAC